VYGCTYAFSTYQLDGDECFGYPVFKEIAPDTQLKETGPAPKPIWTLWGTENLLPLPGMESNLLFGHPLTSHPVISAHHMLA
jgi:hypothetical protein